MKITHDDLTWIASRLEIERLERIKLDVSLNPWNDRLGDVQWLISQVESLHQQLAEATLRREETIMANEYLKQQLTWLTLRLGNDS